MKRPPHVRWLKAASVGIALITGCQTFKGAQDAGFDQRFISIQSVSLFNQRSLSHASAEQWKGDWVFRRHRLDLIDKQLRFTRPDLVVFQELMERSGSYADSDRNILAEGALRNYEWDLNDLVDYEDTQEVQYHATAVALPLSFAMVPDDMKKFYDFVVHRAGEQAGACLECPNALCHGTGPDMVCVYWRADP